jgi:hypothetical protein
MDSLFAYCSIPKTLRDIETDLNIQSWTFRNTFALHTPGPCLRLFALAHLFLILVEHPSILEKISDIRLYLNPLKYERAVIQDDGLKSM